MAEKVLKPLAELLGDIERQYDEHWQKRERREPGYEQKQKARGLLGQILPPAFNVPRAELVNRIKLERLRIAADTWTWGDGNVVLLGPSQTGKTSTAAYLVRRLVLQAGNGKAWERVDRIHFIPAPDLVASVREFPLGQGEPDLVRAAKAASLLVLDDVKPGMDVDLITRVLDFRRSQDRQTVVTSGLTVKEIVANYGEAVWHRMVQCGGRPERIVACFRG